MKLFFYLLLLCLPAFSVSLLANETNCSMIFENYSFQDDLEYARKVKEAYLNDVYMTLPYANGIGITSKFGEYELVVRFLKEPPKGTKLVKSYMGLTINYAVTGRINPY